jgi:hypothetical protein
MLGRQAGDHAPNAKGNFCFALTLVTGRTTPRAVKRIRRPIRSLFAGSAFRLLWSNLSRGRGRSRYRCRREG